MAAAAPRFESVRLFGSSCCCCAAAAAAPEEAAAATEDPMPLLPESPFIPSSIVRPSLAASAAYRISLPVTPTVAKILGAWNEWTDFERPAQHNERNAAAQEAKRCFRGQPSALSSQPRAVLRPFTVAGPGVKPTKKTVGIEMSERARRAREHDESAMARGKPAGPT